jgi:hypothetical protein
MQQQPRLMDQRNSSETCLQRLLLVLLFCMAVATASAAAAGGGTAVPTDGTVPVRGWNSWNSFRWGCQPRHLVYLLLDIMFCKLSMVVLYRTGHFPVG